MDGIAMICIHASVYPQHIRSAARACYKSRNLYGELVRHSQSDCRICKRLSYKPDGIFRCQNEVSIQRDEDVACFASDFIQYMHLSTTELCSMIAAV